MILASATKADTLNVFGAMGGLRLIPAGGSELWLGLVVGRLVGARWWGREISKWRLILAAVTLANPLNVSGAMCPSLCAPHKIELGCWFWAGAAVVGRLVGARWWDRGISKWRNREHLATLPTCQP